MYGKVGKYRACGRIKSPRAPVLLMEAPGSRQPVHELLSSKPVIDRLHRHASYPAFQFRRNLGRTRQIEKTRLQKEKAGENEMCEQRLANNVARLRAILATNLLHVIIDLSRNGGSLVGPLGSEGALPAQLFKQNSLALGWAARP